MCAPTITNPLGASISQIRPASRRNLARVHRTSHPARNASLWALIGVLIPECRRARARDTDRPPAPLAPGVQLPQRWIQIIPAACRLGRELQHRPTMLAARRVQHRATGRASRSRVADSPHSDVALISRSRDIERRVDRKFRCCTARPRQPSLRGGRSARLTCVPSCSAIGACPSRRQASLREPRTAARIGRPSSRGTDTARPPAKR